MKEKIYHHNRISECKFGKYKTEAIIEQITFEADNKKDTNLLIAIAEKLGIRKYIISKKTETLEKNERKDLFRIIDAGTDISNFGDPSLWQKGVQKDRISRLHHCCNS